MQYEDRVTISTPEGVDIELILAGLGSRIAGALLDGVIKLVIDLALLAVIGVMSAATDTGSLLFVGVLIPLVFVVEIGYDIAFETLASGRTIGKRAAGTRVVRVGGHPVDFRTSAVRNVLRLVDGPLTGYIAGPAAILLSSRNQRIGDMTAGTIVVRDRRPAEQHGFEAMYTRPPRELAAWDVSGVSASDAGTVRSFLERRSTLTDVARARIAHELADRLRAKVAGAPENLHAEAFLEGVVQAKALRS